MRVDFRKFLSVGVAVLFSTLAVNGASSRETAVVKDVAFNAIGDSLEVTITATEDSKFTYFELKKRGLAKRAMDTRAEIEPGMHAAFTMKGTNPEIIALARQTLANAGFAPKVKLKRTP